MILWPVLRYRPESFRQSLVGGLLLAYCFPMVSPFLFRDCFVSVLLCRPLAIAPFLILVGFWIWLCYVFAGFFGLLYFCACWPFPFLLALYTLLVGMVVGPASAVPRFVHKLGLKP